MVFDASSKEKSCVSLNDCLHSGPSLTSKLFDILIRFRAHNVAIVADIEKAFLQIALNPQQRDLVRFLWFNNVKNLDFNCFENNELIEYRLSRVLFGVTSSSFHLSATLIHHSNKYFDTDPEFVEQLLNSLQVDD